MIPSCILLNPVTRADLQAACVQAEAALQAGLAQASATYWAGWLTLLAGAFAVVGSAVALYAVNRQIRAAQSEAAKQRSHNLKADVYVPAVKALSAGLTVVIKMADLRVPRDCVMDDYIETLPDLYAVHLVAELATIDKFFEAIRGLQELHQALLPKRPFKADGRYGWEEVIDWGRLCTTEMRKVVPSMSAAVVAMREEVDMLLDEEPYTVLIQNVLTSAIDRNELLFSEMMARWRADGEADA